MPTQRPPCRPESLAQCFCKPTSVAHTSLVNLAVLSDAPAVCPPGLTVRMEHFGGNAAHLGWCWARLGVGGGRAREAPSPARACSLTHLFRLPLWPRENERRAQPGSGTARPARAQALPDWPGFLPSSHRGPADREQRGDRPRQIRVRGYQQCRRALFLTRQPLRAR